jgi:hypothetical protein
VRREPDIGQHFIELIWEAEYGPSIAAQSPHAVRPASALQPRSSAHNPDEISEKIP